MGRKLFPQGMPAPAVIWDQIQLAQLSTTVYAMLPVLGEFFIEEGYTRYGREVNAEDVLKCGIELDLMEGNTLYH